MNIKEHMTPEKLEKYSFYWSELRLILAAVALLIGGIPLIYRLGFYGLSTLLGICWIISGIASVYLLYRWSKSNKKLFGEKDIKTTIAFFVMTISGINLGVAGLIGTNIGMNISSSYFAFLVVATLYILSGWHLWKKWKANGRRMFMGPIQMEATESEPSH